MKKLTTRQRNVIVLAVVLALSIAGAFFLAPAARERTASSAIPQGAFLLVTLDLVKLRESPLSRELSALREVSDVSEECGFDPLARAKSIAIGVPEKPDGVFGIAITHDLAEADLAKCAERVMSIRSAMPRFTQKGSWTVLEQEGILSEATRAKIAYRDGSPLLVARGDYLATMQGALDGASPRAESDSEHAALRKEALARAHGGAILVATAVLPKSLRDRLKNEMADEAASSESKTATMTAILSVRAVALSIASRDDQLDVFAELECETDAACATLRDFLDRRRKTIAAEPAARFAGISGILDAARLEAHGPALDLSVSAPATEMARAVRAVLGAAFTPPPRPLPERPATPDGGVGASGFSPRP